MTALAILPADSDDPTMRVCCEIDGCTNHALQRVVLAGWPAGEVCSHHATDLAKVWERETGVPVRVRRGTMQRAAA